MVAVEHVVESIAEAAGIIVGQARAIRGPQHLVGVVVLETLRDLVVNEV